MKKLLGIEIYQKVYFVGSLLGLIISIFLLVLRFVYNIYVIDPYYLICGFIICITLFLMVIVSLRENIKEDKGE